MNLALNSPDSCRICTLDLPPGQATLLSAAPGERHMIDKPRPGSRYEAYGSFTAFAISRVASSFLVGPAIDRYGAEGLFTFHLLPLCAGIALLVSFSPEWAVPAYWILAGISSGVAGTLQAAIVAERVAPNRLGAARSVLASMMILASAAGPAIYGWLLNADVSMPGILWATAFAMAIASAVAAAAQFRPAWSAPASDS